MNAPPAVTLPLSTRAARESDLEFLVALRRQWGEAAVTDAELAAQWRSQLDGAAIVELDGVPVGLFRVLRGAHEWSIQRVQLLPAHRRAGIGTRLIGALLDEARSAGVRVSLSVLKANPARSLYERLGFVVTGECENGYSMRKFP